jgi:hypothetical protein
MARDAGIMVIHVVVAFRPDHPEAHVSRVALALWKIRKDKKWSILQLLVEWY